MITEEQMPYETMKKRARTHRCAVCDSRLAVAWGGAHGYNCHILRCGKDITHDIITEPRRSDLERAMIDVLKGRRHMDSTALMKMDEKTMMARVNQARWPKDLTVQDKAVIATVAVAYGLDPLLQELMIFQGAPYVTINARYRKAQETGRFGGINANPATKEEREERGAKDGDILYRCEVWRTDAAHPFIGWGRVRAAEIMNANKFTPLSTDPHRMAEKRSEAQALRKAFSLPIPFGSWEEAEEQLAAGETIEGSYTEVKEERVVNRDTGEIQEDIPFAEPEESEEPGHNPGPVTENTLARLKLTMNQAGWKKADDQPDAARLGMYCKRKGWKVKSFKGLTEDMALTAISDIEAGVEG